MKSITAIIETPKHSTEKYKYEPQYNAYRLKKILPSGLAFPFDFGFIPGTKGEDGDPLDVIVISEFHTFPGCLVSCRLIGAILGEQTQDGNTFRNDRFLAVPEMSVLYSHVTTIRHLPPGKLEELRLFFILYNELQGRIFTPLKFAGIAESFKLINQQTDAGTY